MALRNRRTAVAVLTAFAIALVALVGCTRVVTAPAGSAANTVTASGTGTVQATPDTALMSFGVTVNNANAKTALDDASKIASQITSAVQKPGVALKDIQTQNVSVFPQTTGQGGKQIITSYQASLSIQVKVRDIGKLGDVITAANAGGANSINGPSFTVADPAPFRAKAIEKAVADARKSAEAMAKAAGKSVGGVLSISSSDAGALPGLGFDTAEATAKGVPIQPGQLDIASNVTVIFELK